MHLVTARLEVSSDVDYPLNVVVERKGKLISIVPVRSKIEGDAMIKRILDGLDQATLGL